MRLEKMWSAVKPRALTWRFYAGGAAFLFILMQALTGLYMIFYYEPALKDTYAIVQYFNNQTALGSLTRNLHRYGAFALTALMFVHFWRAYFRADYQGGRLWYWLTGLLLSVIVASFLISGSILPWEWKGYWIMEMFNNWLKNVPLVGGVLYDFFMTSYTPTRNFVIHNIILPLICFILLEIHCLGRLKKRGFRDFLVRQAFATLPLIAAVTAVSLALPMPTEDPEIIPLPMEGVYIPAPEWFFVSFLIPYWYVPPRLWPLYLFWIPFALLTLAALLPLINRRAPKAEREAAPPRRRLLRWLAYSGAGVAVCAALTGSFLWGSAPSPWMGCNSCHNRAMGERMGIPPITYKDRDRNPLLTDSRWMIRHWYQPQVVW